MIYLDPAHLQIVQNILKKYPHKVFAFGSRVKGTHRLLSDLDLMIQEPLSDLDLFYLNTDFEESDLPFKVDIVRWADCSKDYQNSIKEDLVLLPKN